MILILLSILVILQKHLNLVIHLRPNIIGEAARNNSQYTKAERTQRSRSESDYIRLLERRAGRGNDLVCDAGHFCEGRGAEGECGEKGRY